MTASPHNPPPITPPGSPAPAAGHGVRWALLVDAQPRVRDSVGGCLQRFGVGFHHAANLQQARDRLAQQAFELMVIQAALPDGSGLAFGSRWLSQRPGRQLIISAPGLDSAQLLTALRAGAADVLADPLDLPQAAAAVRRALDRRRDHERMARRLTRLRQLCRRIDDNRRRVSQQVDLLCNDIVTGYQELADQVHRVTHTADFADHVRGEGDIEQVVRKTLAHVLEQAGTTNAVMFVPGLGDEFRVGGYVSADWPDAGAQQIFDDLSVLLAPRLAAASGHLSLPDVESMHAFDPAVAALLSGCQLLGFPCRHEGELLAAVALFRAAEKPFAPELGPTLAAVGRLAGKSLARARALHHRAR